MKTYICKVEGLLMTSPAVILHEGQKLQASEDTVEIFAALKAGQLELLDSSKGTAAEPQTETQTTAAEKPLAESRAETTAVEETPAQKPRTKGGKK